MKKKSKKKEDIFLGKKRKDVIGKNGEKLSSSILNFLNYSNDSDAGKKKKKKYENEKKYKKVKEKKKKIINEEKTNSGNIIFIQSGMDFRLP
jgi:hypothetical protein